MASNNNGNMFDSYGITKMLEMISDNYEQNQSLAKNDFAEQMLRQILEVMKVGNAKQLDKKIFKQLSRMSLLLYLKVLLAEVQN